MHCSGRNKQLLSYFWMAYHSVDLKLQFTFNNKNELVCRMDEILPTLSWWINPQVAAEASSGPVLRYILFIDRCHRFLWSVFRLRSGELSSVA